MAGAVEDAEVTVLGVWPSPFAIAVRVALNVKGVRHTYVEEDLVDKSELLLRSNPAYRKVPVLIHNGRPVCDSRVILQHIDEAWAATGPPILPREVHDRAVARFWAAYVHGEIDPAWRAFAWARTDEARAAAVARLVAALDTMEGAFEECAKGEGRPFFGGDGVGYVDVVLGGFLPWFGAIDEMAGGHGSLIDAARTPRLAAWAGRFRAADAARGVVPSDAGKVVEYFRALQARWPGAPGD
ncbi:probable glutathione S-transferase GSTU6 [Phragmites australis]|uniref:probable glutathione S-transferase GSTU6 n=1 Tax=Phragmites australis TaxID=29695 RepID=UPI002D78A7AC|nr:probable glutathione S-transferase GSTU6 [Phragmites australis]